MKLVSQYYMEKVISLGADKLKLKDMPYDPRHEGIRIEPELFFWRLYHGNKYIECRSETEAEYCKLMMEARQDKVAIPKDEEYLKEILPELKRLKAKHDEAIEDKLYTIFSKKIREKILSLFWQRIFDDKYFDWEAFMALEDVGE